MAPTENSVTIKNILENLAAAATDGLKAVTPAAGRRSRSSRRNEAFTISGDALQPFLDTIKAAVIDLVKLVEEETERTDKLQEKLNKHEEKFREYDDEIDFQKQKNMKGKMILTSPMEGKKTSHIKSKATLEHEGSDLTKHVIGLIETKYGIEILEDDIQYCSETKKGGIVVSFWKKSYGSAYHKVASAVRSSLGKGINIYLNFMLTQKRSKLLYAVRKMKKDGDISKFYSDELGNISIKRNNSNLKEKITNIPQKDSPMLKTLTEDELKEMVMNS